MKKIYLFAVAVTAAAMLCGCGKKSEPQAAEKPFVIEEGKTILRVSPVDDNVTFEGMSDDDLQRLCQLLVNRLESAAYSGYELEFEDSRTLAVKNVVDSEKLRQIVSAKGVFTVTETDGTVCMTGDALEGAWYSATDDPNMYVIELDFTPEGTQELAEITDRVSQKPEEEQYLSFILDGEEFSKPKVDKAVNKSSVDIEGGADSEKVTAIAVVLNSGELPVDLQIVEDGE